MVAVNTVNTFGVPEGAYGVGDPISGGGTVIHIGQPPFEHSGLNPITQYYYRAWSVNREEYSPGVSATAITPATPITTFPWTETFEADSATLGGWMVIAGSGSWGISSAAGGYGLSFRSAIANFYNISGAVPFHLFSHPVDISGLDEAQLKFDWAYAPYGTEVDRLEIYTSVDNGATYQLLHGMNGGASGPLVTAPPTTSSFVPTASQWNTMTLPLPAGTQYIRFTGISAYGNNLYVDNVKVEQPPAVPLVTMMPVAINFGSTLVGTPSAFSNVTISNSGGGVLEVEAGSIALTGDNSEDFEMNLANLPASLSAGQSVTIPVRFNPDRSGDKTAAVVFSRAGRDSYEVSLSGKAYPETALYESFEGTFPPAGWANPGTWSRSTATAQQGVASASKFTSTTHNILSTPVLAIDENSTLDFHARTTAANTAQRIQIKYSTDRVTWENIGEPIALASNAPFAAFSVPLGSLSAKRANYYIGIAAYNTSATGTVYVDQVFGPEPAALAPDPVTLTAPAHAATNVNEMPTLTWTPAATGGVPTSYTVYCDEDENPRTEVGTVATATFTFATPLSYSGTYYWKVVANNANGSSADSAIRSFTVRDNPTIINFPWLADFNATPFPPVNWTHGMGTLGETTVITTGSAWTHGIFGNVAGSNNSAHINVYSTKNHWLFTPPIDLSVRTNYQLEFDIALTPWTGTAQTALGPDD
ncbi:MAG: choice-of-anchor J domain-containing protein, partial [Candidatus Cloacimonadaceae bacterium]|nr:choice-of-anchor J domain-containing protein [Candidatus Cloacimonadaceae bacterium]